MTARLFDKVDTLQQACERHAMVAKAVEAASADPTTAVRMTEHLDAAWRALIAPLADDVTDVLAQAVELTMPAHATSLVRRADSLPAAFAFVAIIDAVRRVDFKNDLAVRDVVRSAWNEWDRRRKQANNVEEGFGCDDSASWHTLRDVLDKEDPELINRILRIAKLAGRMFDSMGYVKRRVRSDDPQEVKSATIGGDVARLLPSELAKLGNGSTRDQTMMRVLKKQAQVFRMKGVRNKVRGPLVLAIDESGSMHDLPGQDGRNTWAKAAAVALTRVAWSESRPVRVVHFGTATVLQEVPKDDLDAMWRMARSFLSGGTDFVPALRTARGQVGDLEKAGYVGADIVMITDGVEGAYVAHDREIDLMDRDGIRLWTVTVGQAVPDDAPVKKRAALYVHARDIDLPKTELAAELAAQLQGAALAADKRELN
jgi:Mg-chelatase subunit ChlD